MKLIKLTALLLFTISIIIFLVIIAKRWMDSSPLFVIRNTEVKGNELVTEKSIVSLIDINSNMRIFNIDKNNIKDKITTNPFVKEVSIKRIFPSTISIKIREKTPLAFVISKKNYILSEMGELLPMPEQIRVYDIPTITGIKNIEARVKNNEIIEELKISSEVLNLLKKVEISLYYDISEINFENSALMIFYLYEKAIPVFLNKTDLYRKFYYFSQFLEYAKFEKLLENIKYINLCYKDQIIMKE